MDRPQGPVAHTSRPLVGIDLLADAAAEADLVEAGSIADLDRERARTDLGEERAAGGMHSGIDIAAPRNTVIETPLAGTVTEAGWHPVYGFMAVLDHGRGLSTVYGHNSRLVVRVGDRVKKGDAVAFLGNTGESSAPHLHFEVRKDGFAVDPLYLLKPKEGS